MKKGLTGILALALVLAMTFTLGFCAAAGADDYDPI